MTKKAYMPVLPLNSKTLSSLMSENTYLRDALESEKSLLSQSINSFQEHVLIAKSLLKSGRISSNSFDIFSTVSLSLGSSLEPTIVFKNSVPQKHSDLSDQVHECESLYDEIQKEFRDISQKHSSLAIDEQKLSIQNRNLKMELSKLQMTVDELIKHKDQASQEITDFEDLLDHWRSVNQRSEQAIGEVMKDLRKVNASKEEESLQMLQELSAIYDSLESASKKLQSLSAK